MSTSFRTIIAGCIWGLPSFTWGQATFQGLGDLPGGPFESAGFGVSADGRVVVGYSLSGLGYEAFRWSNGTITGLGDLSGGAFISEARGVSADGSVVVGSSETGSDFRAFRWVGGVMTPIDPPSGYQRSFAFGMSGDGGPSSDASKPRQAFGIQPFVGIPAS